MKIKARSLTSRLAFTGIVSLTVLAGEATHAQAATITSLYNTGVDSSGTVLVDGTIGDPHYTLISVPGGTTDIRVRRSAGGYPIGPFIGDNSLSAWIGPNNNNQIVGPVGSYTYRTTFDLTGLIASTASITGGWSTDNNGLQILLNGVDTGIAGTSFSQFSQGFATFNISSGFQSGINTLDFVVSNGGGPTALRTQLVGTATAIGTTAVPEPSEILGTAIAFGSVVMLKRNLTKKKIKPEHN